MVDVEDVSSMDAEHASGPRAKPSEHAAQELLWAGGIHHVDRHTRSWRRVRVLKLARASPATKDLASDTDHHHDPPIARSCWRLWLTIHAPCALQARCSVYSASSPVNGPYKRNLKQRDLTEVIQIRCVFRIQSCNSYSIGWASSPVGSRASPSQTSWTRVKAELC
ncbi:hypothetical protein LIA77_03915 [Sarocladium implicatum]|nr:hypothetical protein LIA77_03915 [Sarocladium implicatum]